LLYATGGAAWARVDYTAIDPFSGGCAAGGNCALASFSQTKSGYVVGGGGEWAPWANNWIFRVEYLYYHFNSTNSTDGLVGFPNLLVTFNWGDLSIQEVRGSVAYKF
jgi:opacity protein-like surface antigen